jgi:hypothetical protein
MDESVTSNCLNEQKLARTMTQVPQTTKMTSAVQRTAEYQVTMLTAFVRTLASCASFRNGPIKNNARNRLIAMKPIQPTIATKPTMKT